MKKICLFLALVLLCSCNDTKNSKINKLINKDELNNSSIHECINISFYQDGALGGFDKLDDYHESTWIKKKDIIVFSVLYGDEKHYNYAYFQDAFANIGKTYKDFKKYKIGWNISFRINEKDIYKNIFKPSDVQDFYDYLEVYLYDSYNVPKDTWYTHLQDDEISENTLMTSIKLTAGSNFDDIISDITVKAFTYKDNSEFDDNNDYVGNCFNTIIVSNK